MARKFKYDLVAILVWLQTEIFWFYFCYSKNVRLFWRENSNMTFSSHFNMIVKKIFFDFNVAIFGAKLKKKNIKKITQTFIYFFARKLLLSHFFSSNFHESYKLKKKLRKFKYYVSYYTILICNFDVFSSYLGAKIECYEIAKEKLIFGIFGLNV